jgi:hypothetical protein
MAPELDEVKNKHKEVWGLIPWYVNGTLAPDEADAVAAHLHTCATCQREAARCGGVSVAMNASSEREWTASPGHFRQILARVDAQDKRTSDPSWLAKLRTLIENTPSPMRWALGAQAALVMLLAAAVLMFAMPREPAMYETLSRASEAPKRSALRVVFSEEATEREIRELLLRMNASIVAGPSPTGAYTIALVDTKASPDALRQTLAGVRANPKVRLAEPLPPEPSE